APDRSRGQRDPERSRSHSPRVGRDPPLDLRADPGTGSGLDRGGPGGAGVQARLPGERGQARGAEARPPPQRRPRPGAGRTPPARLPAAPAPPSPPVAPVAPSPPISLGKSGNIMRVGSDIHIETDQVVIGDVMAVGGDITVDGHVEGDVVAMGGDVYMHSGGK